MSLTPPPAPSSLAGPSREEPAAEFEMVYAGHTRRAYANTLADFLDVLAPGYSNLDGAAQWTTRLHLALKAQVSVQARLAADPRVETLPRHQREVLLSSRDTPPAVPTWDCPIPLVLVASYYRPAGQLPRPVRDAGMEPNVWWLDPSDDIALLMSLHDADYIAINVTTAQP